MQSLLSPSWLVVRLRFILGGPMRKPLVSSVIALAGAVALLGFSQTASADSGLPRGYSADAFFTTTSGCVRSFVGVLPVAFKDRNTGQVVGASMNMQLEQFDVCTNTVLLQASPGIVSFTPGEFEMSAGLNKATLKTNVTMHDSISARDFPVSIDLVYRVLEPRSDSCSEQVDPGETTTYCSAVVEGIVSDGTTNFTPDPGDAVFQEHRLS
jgi:hypothetical protein